MTISK